MREGSRRVAELAVLAAISALADRLDTLMVRGDPPKYAKLPLKEALVLIRSEAPQKFDVRLVDALLIATEWNEFRTPDFERMKKTMKTPVIFDGRNIYEPSEVRALGFKYFGIGRA